MNTAADIPLRQRKQAQTRLALLDATLARLDRRTLDEIPVKELCDAASISQASFFNYFPSKSDVLIYFVQLWSLDLAWRVAHELADRPARAAIHEIFAATARQVRDRPGIMREVLAYQARLTGPAAAREVPLAERILAYPDRPGIGDVPAIGLGGLLPPLIARAVAEGDLPRHVDQRAAFLGLSAIFFGVPVAILRADPALLEGAYRAQIDIFWSGLAASAPRSAPRARSTVKKGKS